MPNLDGTGPNGRGCKTGRGMGNCSGSMSRGTGRPCRRRMVNSLPRCNRFGPIGYSEINEPIQMTVEEYETIRLIDQLNLTQEEAAAEMNVARTTVQSIYQSARKKLSDSLINNKEILIEGGNYSLKDE